MAAARLTKIFKGTVMAAGGFEPDAAEEIIEKGDADLVAFGPAFHLEPRPAPTHPTGPAAQSV